MTINLNDTVSVQLTQRGRDILAAHREGLRARFPRGDWSAHNRENHDGTLRLQLWEVAHLFGPHIYNGCEPPISMEIELTTSPSGKPHRTRGTCAACEETGQTEPGWYWSDTGWHTGPVCDVCADRTTTAPSGNPPRPTSSATVSD